MCCVEKNMIITDATNTDQFVGKEGITNNDKFTIKLLSWFWLSLRITKHS